MREVVLDTETTGLDAERGDRIVEIGCVELVNLMPTGRVYHVYIDPKREMSAKATEITGLTDAFLRGKPVFEAVASSFAEFLADDVMVIHNAPFDIGFINKEFSRVGIPPVAPSRVVDTLTIAKKKFPGAQSSLDALCRRYGVDNSAREKHGALLDAELLAEVYLELCGGRQPDFVLGRNAGSTSSRTPSTGGVKMRARRRESRLTDAEAEAHRAFVEELGQDAAWRAVAFLDRYRKERSDVA